MADVVISANTPTSRYSNHSAPVTFLCSHGVGVDPDTITLVLTDSLGNSTTALGLLQAAATGYEFTVTQSGTNYVVALRYHPAFTAGTWTAVASADSVDGGDDGTLTWTFGVTSVLSSILEEIPNVLDGSSGSGRTMPAGRFRFFETGNLESVKALAASGKTQPYVMSVVSLGDAPDLPANVSGDYVYSSHIVRLSVLYALRPNNPLELEQTISNDEFQLRRVLEWPDNWADVDGWCGTTVIDETTEEVGDERIEVVAHHLDLLVQHRELHT